MSTKEEVTVNGGKWTGKKDMKGREMIWQSVRL